MYVMPRSGLGRTALVMIAVLLFYPLYWSVFTLLPESARMLSIVLVGAIVAVGLVGAVLGGVSLRRGDRSLLLVVAGGLMILLVLMFAVGESGVFGSH